MINQIYSFIQKHHLLPGSDTVILGLSGGPDSMFLLHVLATLHQEKKISLVAAHLDHEWRSNSSHDVDFCRKAAQEYGIPFVTAKASAIATQPKKNGSLEEFGRKLRRTFLENVAREHNAQIIALAHHLQDQEETFFIRLIRGTTLTGLIGMKPKHGIYIRPLLETNKADILGYLKEHTINYLEDPTNNSESYLRNRIRLNVLPKLEESDQRFGDNFLRTMGNLHAAEEALEGITQTLFNEITKGVDGTVYLDLVKFFKTNPYLQKRILVHWLITEKVPFLLTERFLNEILRFFSNQEGTIHSLHATWALVKEKNFVHLKKN